MLTQNLLLNLLEEHRCTVVKSSTNPTKKYEDIRLYSPERPLRSGCLYLVDSRDYAQIAETGQSAAVCLLLSPDEPVPEGADFAVASNLTPLQVFDMTQDLSRRLLAWDRELTVLLLQEGSLQQLLDCSAPILNAPCFLQDSNFHVLASCGSVSEEESPFFYETLHSGRAPSSLFARLLTLAPRQPYRAAGARTGEVKVLGDQQVLVADCCVDGVPVLHFGLYCPSPRRGLSDLISHLMQRLSTGPAIRRLTGKSTDLHDALFAKLLEEPDAPEASDICDALGLSKQGRYTAACIDFGEAAHSRVIQLRALYPRFRFFRYREQIYALMESTDPDRAQLLQRLRDLGAAYGLGLDHCGTDELLHSCDQAAYALLAESQSAYRDVMFRHMVSEFFSRHPFSAYCPAPFRQLLEDDAANGTDNLKLLSAFLAGNCNATAVSRELHMHRNNVLYRMEKIKTRYGFDLTDAAERQLLQLLCVKALTD